MNDEAVRLIERVHIPYVSERQIAGTWLAKDIVAKLAAANLLATPAMRRAVEACKALASDQSTWRYSNQGPACMDAGKALLAEEAERAPKPRWSVDAEHYIVDRDTGHRWLGGDFSRRQAEAVRDTLNGLEHGK